MLEKWKDSYHSRSLFYCSIDGQWRKGIKEEKIKSIHVNTPLIKSMASPWLILNIWSHCLSSWSLPMCQGNIEQILVSGILQWCIMWFWIKWNSLCKRLHLFQLIVMKYNYEQLVLDICANIYIVEDLKRVPICSILKGLWMETHPIFKPLDSITFSNLVHSMCLLKLNLLKRGYTFIF